MKKYFMKMTSSWAKLMPFILRLLNADIPCGCLFRVLVLIIPARTKQPVKLVLPREATAVCVLLDSRVRNVKMVRELRALMKARSLSLRWL